MPEEVMPEEVMPEEVSDAGGGVWVHDICLR
jgi:hypothetical protein